MAVATRGLLDLNEKTTPHDDQGNIGKLTVGGFKYGAHWPRDWPDEEACSLFIKQFPTKPGVYAFVADNEVVYVGKAQKQGLRKRLRKYLNPNNTGTTAAHVRSGIAQALDAGNEVKVFFITPDEHTVPWRGFSTNVIAGLEEGLIQDLQPVWNRHGIRDPDDEDEGSE